MGRTRSVLGTVVFLFAAPGVVAGFVPYLLNHWTPAPSGPRWLGLVPMVPAALLLPDAFARFAWEGRGTPAPIAPTQSLVASGPYRFVRNPMYVAVVALILGQGVLFASGPTLAYGAVTWLTMHLFVVFYEEPRLSIDHSSYDAYRAAVPRWLPRLTPWTGEVAAAPPE